MQNVENSFSGSNEQYAEIVRLKEILFEQVQEKDSLMKTVSDLKNDLKIEENRNIDREIALEKKIKQLDNIIFKREHTYIWKATSVPALDPSHSSTTIKVEVPKELPKVSMVYTSLKELKRYLTGFDLVVKERTTATAITEGTWGFEHTKACFRDEIIPFIKELKDIFNNFNQYLVEELADVQKVFYQMEQAVEQHRLESRTFEVKINQVLNENERLLAQAIDNDIVTTVVNLSVNEGCETVNECQRCLELKTELLNKKDFVDKETYDKLCKSFTNLEKHCITLEADSQLNQEIFQLENSALNQNAPSFTQLFELSELRAQSLSQKNTVQVKLKERIMNEVPSRKPIVLESESPKPVVKLVYSRKPRKNKNTESVSKTKVIKPMLSKSSSGIWTPVARENRHDRPGDRSQLTNFISKFLGTVKFRNDQVAKIMGYGDYQIGNVTISRVYYVEGLGHNLFSVGQFCDSNLEVAFRQHTCFIRNLEGVDLLTGSQGDNL
ncbi:hypothetical protein Tco_0072116 [Tanacetum coccineum]